MSPFPLGPSLGQGSLLRPGGHLLRCGGLLSRLLRPGGRRSQLLGPGGRRSRLLGPGGRRSRLLGPSGRRSRLLGPGGRRSRLLGPGGRRSRLLCPGGRLTCQSHHTSPPACQSHHTSPPACQSHLTSPPACQSQLTSPPTCQSHLTPQWSTQCPFTSLLSRPPCPGGLLSHWPYMDLALCPLPRFHLRSTALLDFALCKRLEAALRGGGLCYESGCHSLQLHITHGLHLPSYTALTHSHPPSHQSHSCHQSLICPDCFTTPAPHSHTHI